MPSSSHARARSARANAPAPASPIVTTSNRPSARAWATFAAFDGPRGNGLLPVVRPAVIEHAADHGRLQVAQPAVGRGGRLVNRGEQSRVQLGELRLDSRATPRRSFTGPQRGTPWPGGGRQHGEQGPRSQYGHDRHDDPGRPREDHPERGAGTSPQISQQTASARAAGTTAADRRPGSEPATARCPDRSPLRRVGTAHHPSPGPGRRWAVPTLQVPGPSVAVRIHAGGGLQYRGRAVPGQPARQPGLDDQDHNHHHDRRDARASGTTSSSNVLQLPLAVAVGRRPRRPRHQPATHLFQPRRLAAARSCSRPGRGSTANGRGPSPLPASSVYTPARPFPQKMPRPPWA